MYLGVSFNCSGRTDGEGLSIGGTENLLTEDPKTYRNQMLLEPEEDPSYTCNISASAPRDDVDAVGTTADLGVT